MSVKLSEIKVDDEFRDLASNYLSSQQVAELEMDMAANGIREPLAVWRETGILLDGHQRLTLIRESGFLVEDPTIHEYSFASRSLAKRWMLLRHLGRPGLSAARTSYYRGKLYGELKTGNGDRVRSKTIEHGPVGEWFVAKGATNGSAADMIGRRYGVCGKTVRRDARFAEAVDSLPVDQRKSALQ